MFSQVEAVLLDFLFSQLPQCFCLSSLTCGFGRNKRSILIILSDNNHWGDLRLLQARWCHRHLNAKRLVHFTASFLAELTLELDEHGTISFPEKLGVP